MKILLIHNFYLQSGGEDQVFLSEYELLKSYGHNVIQYVVHNNQLREMTSIQLAQKTIWNHKTFQDIRTIISTEQPHIVHFHNIFPLISPSAYYAVGGHGTPIVQTLHNYRLFCPQGMCIRDDDPCELCIERPFSWPGIRYACYRNSRLATGVLTVRNFLHTCLSTWCQQVDLYFALSEFSREKFIQGGLPPEKVVVKPNFVRSLQTEGKGEGNFALFVGRLSHEKGVQVLLDAWKGMQNRIPLKIIGDGPLLQRVQQYAEQHSTVEALGRKDQETIRAYMKDAAVLLFPSLCYENMPLVIAEAYAAGLPVIASRLGSMSDLVRHNITGLHFHPKQTTDLIKQVEWFFEHPMECKRMRLEARKEFETKYTPEKNHALLIQYYEQVIAAKDKKEPIHVG